MKNLISLILAVLLAVGIGSLFMKSTSTDQEMDTMVNSSTNLKAFQVGAFTNKESAMELATSLDAKIIHDESYYYVYYGILSKSENIEKMIKYLNDNNIYYYVKNIDASLAFKDELLKYEELMKETTSDIAFIELNKRILDIYEVKQ